MRLIKVVIWLATVFFVVMLFSPLVTEMLAYLWTSNSPGPP